MNLGILKYTMDYIADKLNPDVLGYIIEFLTLNDILLIGGQTLLDYEKKHLKFSKMIKNRESVMLHDYETRTETYSLHERLHRSDGPAKIVYNEFNNMILSEWYFNGVLHRLHEPARTEYYWNCVWITTDYIANAERGRNSRECRLLDGPLRIKRVSWFQNGVRHRCDGPAFVEYYPSGKIQSELWRPSRSDGPSRLAYYESGQIEHECWEYQGLPHRSDGPSSQSFNEDGSIKKSEWYKLNRPYRHDGVVRINYASW